MVRPGGAPRSLLPPSLYASGCGPATNPRLHPSERRQGHRSTSSAGVRTGLRRPEGGTKATVMPRKKGVNAWVMWGKSCEGTGNVGKSCEGTHFEPTSLYQTRLHDLEMKDL